MVNTKVVKSIPTIIAIATLPCGCFVRVSRIEKGRSLNTNNYVCKEWKRHKYEVSKIGKDLAKQVTKMKRDFIK